MTIEELKAKDWQILTAHTIITNHAYLRTILEMQVNIIAELKGITLKEANEKAQVHLKENLAWMDKKVKEEFPDYPKES